MKTNERKNNFIIKSLDKHNSKYDYSKVIYVNTETKVCIICPIHGEFMQRPMNHLKNDGCSKCKITPTPINGHKSIVQNLQSELAEKEKELSEVNNNYYKLLEMSLYMSKLLERTLDFDTFLKNNNLPNTLINNK